MYVRKAVVLTAAVLAGVGLHAHYSAPHTIEHTITDVRTITVDRPVLTEKIVTKILSDPKDKALIADLIRKNWDLNVAVTGLNQTIAYLASTGGGTVTPPVDVTVPDPFRTFKDFQLFATWNTKEFHYRLDQKFEVLSTTGKRKDGSQVALVDVFQIGNDGQRIKLKTTTTAIFADERVPRWFVSGRIQAGLGVMPNKELGGVVALQWLKHGKSPSTEDVRFAVLSPAVFVSKTTYDVGVLPISYNLGILPHQPFTNIFISPFVSRTRVGGVISATF